MSFQKAIKEAISQNREIFKEIDRLFDLILLEIVKEDMKDIQGESEVALDIDNLRKIVKKEDIWDIVSEKDRLQILEQLIYYSEMLRETITNKELTELTKKDFILLDEEHKRDILKLRALDMVSAIEEGREIRARMKSLSFTIEIPLMLPIKDDYSLLIKCETFESLIEMTITYNYEFIKSDKTIVAQDTLEGLMEVFGNKYLVLSSGLADSINSYISKKQFLRFVENQILAYFELLKNEINKMTPFIEDAREKSISKSEFIEDIPFEELFLYNNDDLTIEARSLEEIAKETIIIDLESTDAVLSEKEKKRTFLFVLGDYIHDNDFFDYRRYNPNEFKEMREDTKSSLIKRTFIINKIDNIIIDKGEIISFEMEFAQLSRSRKDDYPVLKSIRDTFKIGRNFIQKLPFDDHRGTGQTIKYTLSKIYIPEIHSHRQIEIKYRKLKGHKGSSDKGVVIMERFGLENRDIDFFKRKTMKPMILPILRDFTIENISYFKEPEKVLILKGFITKKIDKDFKPCKFIFKTYRTHSDEYFSDVMIKDPSKKKDPRLLGKEFIKKRDTVETETLQVFLIKDIKRDISSIKSIKEMKDINDYRPRPTVKADLNLGQSHKVKGDRVAIIDFIPKAQIELSKNPFSISQFTISYESSLLISFQRRDAQNFSRNNRYILNRFLFKEIEYYPFLNKLKELMSSQNNEMLKILYDHDFILDNYEVLYRTMLTEEEFERYKEIFNLTYDKYNAEDNLLDSIEEGFKKEFADYTMEVVKKRVKAFSRINSRVKEIENNLKYSIFIDFKFFEFKPEKLRITYSKGHKFFWIDLLTRDKERIKRIEIFKDERNHPIISNFISIGDIKNFINNLVNEVYPKSYYDEDKQLTYLESKVDEIEMDVLYLHERKEYVFSIGSDTDDIPFIKARLNVYAYSRGLVESFLVGRLAESSEIHYVKFIILADPNSSNIERDSAIYWKGTAPFDYHIEDIRVKETGEKEIELALFEKEVDTLFIDYLFEDKEEKEIKIGKGMIITNELLIRMSNKVDGSIWDDLSEEGKGLIQATVDRITITTDRDSARLYTKKGVIKCKIGKGLTHRHKKLTPESVIIRLYEIAMEFEEAKSLLFTFKDNDNTYIQIYYKKGEIMPELTNIGVKQPKNVGDLLLLEDETSAIINVRSLKGQFEFEINKSYPIYEVIYDKNKNANEIEEINLLPLVSIAKDLPPIKKREIDYTKKAKVDIFKIPTRVNKGDRGIKEIEEWLKRAETEPHNIDYKKVITQKGIITPFLTNSEINRIDELWDILGITEKQYILLFAGQDVHFDISFQIIAIAHKDWNNIDVNSRDSIIKQLQFKEKYFTNLKVKIINNIIQFENMEDFWNDLIKTDPFAIETLLKDSLNHKLLFVKIISEIGKIIDDSKKLDWRSLKGLKYKRNWGDLKIAKIIEEYLTEIKRILRKKKGDKTIEVGFIKDPTLKDRLPKILPYLGVDHLQRPYRKRYYKYSFEFPIPESIGRKIYEEMTDSEKSIVFEAFYFFRDQLSNLRYSIDEKGKIEIEDNDMALTWLFMKDLGNPALIDKRREKLLLIWGDLNHKKNKKAEWNDIPNDLRLPIVRELVIFRELFNDLEKDPSKLDFFRFEPISLEEMDIWWSTIDENIMHSFYNFINYLDVSVHSAIKSDKGFIEMTKDSVSGKHYERMLKDFNAFIFLNNLGIIIHERDPSKFSSSLHLTVAGHKISELTGKEVWEYDMTKIREAWDKKFKTLAEKESIIKIINYPIPMIKHAKTQDKWDALTPEFKTNFFKTIFSWIHWYLSIVQILTKETTYQKLALPSKAEEKIELTEEKKKAGAKLMSEYSIKYQSFNFKKEYKALYNKKPIYNKKETKQFMEYKELMTSIISLSIYGVLIDIDITEEKEIQRLYKEYAKQTIVQVKGVDTKKFSLWKDLYRRNYKKLESEGMITEVLGKYTHINAQFEEGKLVITPLNRLEFSSEEINYYEMLYDDIGIELRHDKKNNKVYSLLPIDSDEEKKKLKEKIDILYETIGDDL